MTTHLQCDYCGKKYKLNKAVDPDKKISCKACGQGTLHPYVKQESKVFALGEQAQAELAAAGNGQTERPPGRQRSGQLRSPSSARLQPASSADLPATPSPAPAPVAAPSRPANSDIPDDMKNLSDQELVERIGDSHRKIMKEVRKKIIGQQEVVEHTLTCIFAAGHALLIGVPGLAKTLLVNSISEALGVGFKRIQFTPDLMPTDITGTDIIQDDPTTGIRQYKFLPGPVFTNILLADEINRTPPKTQAALLEAMQEKQVSVGGTIYPLDKPFFVMATQNPIDQEGTYPLPEAQMDRFLFNIYVDFPERDDEIEIARVVTSGTSEDIQPVVSGGEIMAYQQLIKRAPVSEHVLEYAVNMVRATRKGREEAPDFINDWINISAGPRACLSLISSAKARAILHGRYHVATEDVAAVANPVMRHRISPNFAAQAEGITSDLLVDRLLEHMGA